MKTELWSPTQVSQVTIKNRRVKKAKKNGYTTIPSTGTEGGESRENEFIMVIYTLQKK